MKTLTFFNEKGGTGKTFLTAMFGSWAAYKKKLPTFGLDMDYPSYHLFNMRQQDLKIIQEEPDSQLSKYAMGNNPYAIAKTYGKSSFSQSELDKISASICQQKEKIKEGVILLDFPGRFLPMDPIFDLVSKHLVDLIVFPIDSDRQSRSSALMTYNNIKKINPQQKAIFLWNKEAAKERSGNRDWYQATNDSFDKLGIPYVKTRVHDILIARRDANTFGFIRNTLCWPQNNINKACGYIEDIFEEIFSYLK